MVHFGWFVIVMDDNDIAVMMKYSLTVFNILSIIVILNYPSTLFIGRYQIGFPFRTLIAIIHHINYFIHIAVDSYFHHYFLILSTVFPDIHQIKNSHDYRKLNVDYKTIDGHQT